MKKLLTIVLVIILAAGITVFAAKDIVAKIGVEKGVEAVTGLKLTLDKLGVGIIKSAIDIKGLKIYNPAGFEDKLMLDMPEIYVNYDVISMLKGKVHLPEVRIDLAEFVVVKNKDGKLNLDSLKVAKKGETQPAEKKGGAAPEIKIDKLTLKIGRVLYKDYSKGGAPVVQEFKVNLDEKYSNISDLNALASLIVVKALTNTSIAKLVGFDLSGLEGNVKGPLGTALKTATEAVAKAQTLLKETTKTAKDTAKGATETLKTTAEDLKQVIKIPFEEEKK